MDKETHFQLLRNETPSVSLLSYYTVIASFGYQLDVYLASD